MTKELNKEILKSLGIEIESTPEGFKVYNIGPKVGLSKEIIKKPLKESVSVCKHKYTKDKQYPVYVWSHEGKIRCLTTSRLLYAWFIGDIPAGYDIDHIDNDPFNNSLDNLRMLSREENLAKRYSDNNLKCFNQYHNTVTE